MSLPGAIAPLPESVRAILRRDQNSHPGLQLDKYAETWSESARTSHFAGDVQRQVVDEVARLSQQPPAGIDFDALGRQRSGLWRALGAVVLEAETVGPFTLHLARASALENAGVCLHPVYGCVFLPGSGVKGLTRAFAETVWLPEQVDEKGAWQTILEVFGYSDEGRGRARGSSGEIVFHDAWPAKWPKLQADILNSHHGAYYGAASQDNEHPPGDWEGPNIVSFLAVGAGETFHFALSKRRRDIDPGRLDLATEWLAGALQHLGAGAKTASGYGAFQIVSDGLNEAQAEVSRQTWKTATQKKFAEQTYTLELVTPAFLAGPHPDRADLAGEECTLRPSTLRGQLRWWWRTMHAAWLTVAELRKLEALVWGDTNHAGAVRVTIVPAGPVQPIEFDRRKIVRENKLPEPPNKKTTQGLTYHSYGMDETRGRRFYLSPGTKWKVTLTARSVKALAAIDVIKDPKDGRDQKKTGEPPFALIGASDILQQAQVALALLSRFGGVGSKSRKGFGNFALDAKLDDFVDPQPNAWDRKIRLAAQQFRQQLKRDKPPVQALKAASPALEFAELIWEIPTPWPNYWFALDQVGDAAQRFSQSMKHNLEKKALGLPRNVRAPFSGSFRSGSSVAKTDRHASPIHYHLLKGSDGKYRATLLAFPSAELPTFEISQRFLKQALPQIQTHLVGFITDNGRLGQTVIAAPQPTATTTVARPPSAPALPAIESRVKAVLQSEKTKKGGWIAKHVPSGLVGPIQNSGDVPSDQQPGNEVELIVKVCDARQIAFRYPTPADQAKGGQQKSAPQKPKDQGRRK